MFVFFIIFILLCAYKAKIRGFKEFNREYISRDNTTAIKGFFTFLVFMSHFSQYYNPPTAFDRPYYYIKFFLDQLIVVMFFFYSGYGIFESYKRKGSPYIKQLPKNRILKVVLHLDIALVLFIILNLCLGNKLKPLKVLLALIGWDSLGNSNWFIFVILVLYLIVFISFTLFKNNSIAALCSSTVLTIAYIVIIKSFKDYWWYDTAPCFVLGLWYSFFKEKLEGLFMKDTKTYYISLAVTLAAFIACQTNNIYLLVMFSGNLLFAILICLISMKLTIGNKVLYWLGNHVFSIYMLQRIPMNLFHRIDAVSSHKIINFICSLLITVILSELFDRLTAVIDKKLFKAKSCKKTTQEAKSE